MRDTMITVRTRRAQLATIVSGQKTRSAQVVASINAIIAAAGLSPIDASTFGFLDDCRATDSVSIAGGDRTMTSPDNPWTAADIGKVIHVAGAGAAGAVLVTRIAGYTAAGEIETADAASTAVAATKTSAAGLAAWGWPASVLVNDAPARNAAGEAFQSGRLRPHGMSVFRSESERALERLNVRDFGAIGDWDGTTGTDDTAAIQAAVFQFGTTLDAGTPHVVRFPRGRYRISATITVPPGVVLEGEAIHNGDYLTPGSVIDVTHDGVGVRFVRVNGSSLLTHNGGARHLVFSGIGAAGTHQHLVELGDSANVDVTHGAWHGFIEHCAFNYTQGYAVYSAHSQEWTIRNNYFRSVSYAVFYSSVAASAKICDNSVDNSGHPVDSYGFTCYNGPLGGAAGVIIAGNYTISCTVGVWLSNQIGAIVRDNVFEGCNNECIHLDKYKIGGAVLDSSLGAGWTDGCNCCVINGNTFINWCADAAGSNPAIQITNSRRGYIGPNAYISPNGGAGPAIGVYDGGVDTVDDWVIVEPVVTGANAAIVPPYAAGNGIIARQTMICRDGFKFGLLRDVLSASDKGRGYIDADGQLVIFDGTDPRTTLGVVGPVVPDTGASAGYIQVKVGATAYKIQVYNP